MIGLYGMGMMTAGLTADAGPAVSIGADIRNERFSIGLELRFALPGRVYAREPIDPAKPTSERDFDVTQYSALLVPCVRYGYFVGCGAMQAGLFQAVSRIGDQRILPVLAFGARAGFRIPFKDRFAFFGFGEALFPSVREGIAYSIPRDPSLPESKTNPAPNVAWDPSVAQGYFCAGIEVTFE